jgi:tetratricopeptide (TPR) repeat protein
MRLGAVAFVCFTLGALTSAVVAQKNKPSFDLAQIKGSTPKDAAGTMLETALQLAGQGSWERIAVGRAWYLGGDKARGQQIFDGVTGGKKVADSDWWRIGRVYVEAGEWDKAQKAFDQALTMKPNDDSGMLEYGAWANVQKDRAKAEDLFDKAFRKSPGEFWHWVNAGGSYLGVKPQ